MLSLIAKDFKLLFQGSYKNKLGKILSILFTVIIGAILIVIETYIFRAIFIKLKDIKDASLSYLSVFLFIVSTLLTVFAVVVSKKLFFNESDNTKLQSLPISNFKLVVSKLFFLFITMYFINLVFNLPLFITYGVIYRQFIGFYFKALIYPALLFFFQAGIALFLVYPYKLLSDILDKHFIVKIIVFLLIAFGLTILYSRVLEIFINIVVNNNANSLFTSETMEAIKFTARFMIPVNYLVEGLISKNFLFLLLSLAISLGVFTLGVILVSIFYNKFLQHVIYKKRSKNEKEIEFKTTKPVKALIKKELILLFRNSNLLVSFITLLMIQPLISYLIIQSINTVFLKGSLSYYLLAIPGIIPNLDITLMMLISLIIYQGANNYITNENKTIRLMKSIPITPIQQLVIKVGIPALLSASFLLISYIALAITKVLTVVTMLYAIILNLILLFATSLVNLYEELSLKRHQQKNTLLSTTYTYLLPIIFLTSAIYLAYIGVNQHLIFVIEVVFYSLMTLPFVIRLKSRTSEKFYTLEVIN